MYLAKLFSVVNFCHICRLVTCLLDNADRSDVMAVKLRLEDEKAQRLLVQNDVEALMLKVARLERHVSLGNDGEAPPRMMAGTKLNKEHVERISTLERKMLAAQSRSSVGCASMFVRWGKSTCPDNGTELVYEGYAAGSHYSHKGAAVDYLCLPKDPLWGAFKAGKQSVSGKVYGGEYQFSGQTMFGKDILDEDAPCAVCRAPRSTVMMLPARNVCYHGWNMEYSGYLATGYSTEEAASEYICVDKDPDVVPGGSTSNNGKLFYPVEGICGSLKCPPYVDGRELTCAVCTK